MNHFQWPLDCGGYFRIEWPTGMNLSVADYKYLIQIFALFLRKFKRNSKPKGVSMEIGDIKLNCNLRRN